MLNRQIAKIFYEIGDYLEMKEVAFKPSAYRKAAFFLENLDKDIGRVYEQGGLRDLEKIPGVGENIARKIEEYLKTGKIKEHQKLKKQTPINLQEINLVESMGLKKARILYKELGIRNLKDLEKAARAGKIAPLFGFGKKTEQNILEGIAFLKKSKGRFLLGDIMPFVDLILDKLKNFSEVKQISEAGSLRRRKETIGDVDILAVSSDPEKVMDFFVNLPGVVKIWSKGKTKSSVRVKDDFDIDLRVVPRESYGSALQYFTGSKEHNIALRKIAISKGLKLNEYGIFRGKKKIAGQTEKEVYEKLGMGWIPPEIRENEGEIEASLKNALPKIIGYNEIKGDLHCHSDWNGGKNSIKEMAETALKIGYDYIGISDHTKFLRIERGLNERELGLQGKEIKKLNSKNRSGFKILQGCEANILKDGSMDIKNEALKKLDYAIAGVHSNMKMGKKEMTERIIRAMKNPHIDIISHLTGRLIKKRDEYQIDFEKILRAAKQFKVILEINSSPERLDLKDIYIRMAKNVGVKMAVNTDSHHKDQLHCISFGLAQARRGWAETSDIVNSWPLKKLLNFLK